MTIEIDRIDADRLGRLIMIFELATVYAAALYDVDALNQPGVELGKVLAKRILPELTGTDEPAHDSSTNQLITRYRRLRR